MAPDLPGAPWVLDCYSGGGGAAMGYYRAGFNVLGIDSRPQRRYPFRFVQADALEALATWDLRRFSAIHASPPCQKFSHSHNQWLGRDHPDLVEPTRELLVKSGLPWVMENVVRAPIRADIILCGTMFGLNCGQWELRRHRKFETSGLFLLTPQCQHGLGGRKMLQVYGNAGTNREPKGPKANAAQARELMGISWLSYREMAQAIPPAYTKYIGLELRKLTSIKL